MPGRKWAASRWYDALVVNDDLDQAYDQLRAVYLAAHLGPGAQPRPGGRPADPLKPYV